MATTVAKSGLAIHNNGAIVPRGGAITAGSPVTSAPDNLTQGFTGKLGGTSPISSTSANMGAIKAVSSGIFARPMASSQYVMFRYGTVGGVASTFLNSGAADFGKHSIHVKTNRRSYHITSWNYVTGAATKSSDTNDDFHTDDAATPTRAIPGELIYTDHGLARTGSLAIPLRDDYKAKTE